MAVDFYIKQADTSPPIVAILKDATDTAVDLTGATIRFIMTNKATGEAVVDAAAEIVDADEGRVRYLWVSPNTDEPANYKAEFEVLWPDGTYETFPNSAYITVKVVADLGGVVGTET